MQRTYSQLPLIVLISYDRIRLKFSIVTNLSPVQHTTHLSQICPLYSIQHTCHKSVPCTAYNTLVTNLSPVQHTTHFCQLLASRTVCFIFVSNSAKRDVSFNVSTSCRFSIHETILRLHTYKSMSGDETDVMTSEIIFYLPLRRVSLWNCGIQRGAKVAWQCGQHVKYRMSSDFCATMYFVAFILINGCW